MKDDWKGEHLLQGIKRLRHEGNGNHFKRHTGRPTERVNNTCLHPDCDKPLHRHNTSGVCKAHNHCKECRCMTCMNRKAKV